MSSSLPGLIDPFALASKGWDWQGSVPFARLPRLVAMIVNSEGAAKVELTFSQVGQVVAVTGRVEADLEVVCQRCLDPVRIEVRAVVNLGVVASIAEGDMLPEPYEPLLLEGEKLRFSDIVEDELILAIPAVPRHAECELGGHTSRKTQTKSRSDPFAELAKLKIQ